MGLFDCFRGKSGKKQSPDDLEQRLKKMASSCGPSDMIKEIMNSIDGPLFMPHFESVDDALRFERSVPYKKRKGTITCIIGGLILKNGKQGFVVATGGDISGSEAVAIFDQICKPETNQKGCPLVGWTPPQ